jgi:hypothetical protein
MLKMSIGWCREVQGREGRVQTWQFLHQLACQGRRLELIMGCTRPVLIASVCYSTVLYAAWLALSCWQFLLIPELELVAKTTHY